MSKFRSRDEELFPSRKKKLHRFSKEWKAVEIFSTVTAIFFRVRQPYTGISELNNEVDLRPVQDHLRQILVIKSSTGLIYRVQQKIVLQSPKAKLWFTPAVASQVRRVNFTGVLLFLYFQLNRPLWTPQCRLLLVDNLTQPLLC